MFCTSASDRLGSQKGYPQSRWFKIAPPDRKSIAVQPLLLSSRGHQCCWMWSCCAQSTPTSSLLAPRASSLLSPLLLGTAPLPCLLSPAASPCPSHALSCHHTGQSTAAHPAACLPDPAPCPSNLGPHRSTWGISCSKSPPLNENFRLGPEAVAVWKAPSGCAVRECSQAVK